MKNLGIDLDEWLNSIDGQIREGRSKFAASRLRERFDERALNPIPRERLVRFASLCRRSGLSDLAVRLLHPLARPKDREPLTSTEEERIEYASSLIQIGAVQEGRDLLTAVDSARYPQALLFQALADFSTWDYSASLPALRKYIAAPGLSDYQRMIGKVNYLGALVATEQSEASRSLGSELMKATLESRSFLLYGSVCNYLAQLYIDQGQHALAEEHLEKGHRTLSEVGSLEILFIEKWQAVIELKRGTHRTGGRSRIAAVRKKAVEQRSWETVRDCDFHLATAKVDRGLAEHLYFGTPFPAYRKRLESIEIGDRYIWLLGRGGRNAPVLDIATGAVSTSRERLKIGQVQHRLIQLLSSDFYRPQRLPAMHALLFPGRFYNPVTSPQIVHQGIKRLRGFFEESAFPLMIEEDRGAYSFQSLGCGIRIDRHVERHPSEQQIRDEQAFEALRGKFTGRSFARHEAERALDLSPRSINMLLQRLQHAKRLEKAGSGPKIRYRISPL